MAAAADMFELGVKLQVLKRGTLFAARATGSTTSTRARLTRGHPEAVKRDLEHKISAPDRRRVARDARILARPRPGAVRSGGLGRQAPHGARVPLVPRQVEPLGDRGETARRPDFQIWCGPAMGAFNRWAKGSFLEDPAQRSVVQIALNCSKVPRS